MNDTGAYSHCVRLPLLTVRVQYSTHKYEKRFFVAFHLFWIKCELSGYLYFVNCRMFLEGAKLHTCPYCYVSIYILYRHAIYNMSSNIPTSAYILNITCMY